MKKAWACVAAAILAAAPGSVQATLPWQSFLYQTANVELEAVAESGYGIVILDPSRDGTPEGNWSPEEIAQLRLAGKTVLAGIRVAEAEVGRFYWNPSWVDAELPELRPAWLGPESGEPDIFRVRYWHPDWRSIVEAYVGAVVAQGFDGVVLDTVDAHEFWGPKGRLPSAERNPDAFDDMIELVAAVAAHARSVPGKENFLVVPQDGASLAEDDTYLSIISGIIAENVWFAGDKRQKSRVTRQMIPFLDRVRDAGKRVLVLDYPAPQRHIDTVYDRAESKGYVPLVTVPQRDILVFHPQHPPGVQAPFLQVDPEQNAEVTADVVPSFTWSMSGQSDLTFRVSFTGSESRQRVFTFPKSGTLSTTTFVPKAGEWRTIQRRARDNFSSRIYWWVTTRDANGVLRSSPARTLNRMHTNVPTTIFWVGAPEGHTTDESRETSAWDAAWVEHFGGVDDPQAHGQNPENAYWPDFTPLENPFYVALPYNDFNDNGVRRPNFRDIVPWARFVDYGPLESAVKNRWVKISQNGVTCYGQWEDVGPYQSNDFRYVFGTNKPRNKKIFGTGLEISPALRDCLGASSLSASSWRLVHDDESMPPGPWTEIVTTSQISPP
jgi:uncharacterized protein (TIGR01370 family)